jgi:alginate O-acetyltransferase complex protein AlgI
MVLLIEKYVVLRFAEKLPRVLMHIYALAMISFSWGLFYFDDLGSVGKFYKALFGQSTVAADIAEESAMLNNFWLWAVAILFCMPVRKYAGQLSERLFAKHEGVLATVNTTSRIVASLAILILSVALLVGATNNAFIYTRF